MGMFGGGGGNWGGTLGGLGVDKPSFSKPTTFITSPFTTAYNGGMMGMNMAKDMMGGLKSKADFSLIPEINRNDFILPRGLAQAQTQRGFEQAQQAALGQIAASRGVNPALMMRQGQQASQALYNQAMQQGQIANLAEAQQAQKNLMDYNQMMQDSGKAKLGAQVGISQANAQQQSGLLGGLGTAVAGIASMFSDERMKKDIKSDDKTIEMVLDAFSKSKQWKYKDESNGEGDYVGPMAQDLEKAKPDMVSEASNGMKQVDMNKALMAIMAAQGHLHKKIKKLEKAA